VNSAVTFHVVLLDDFSAVARQAAEAFRRFHEAAIALSRAVARIFRVMLASFAWLRRWEPAELAADFGWQGLARRHALRPPTRGYWVKRCGCAACHLRRVLPAE